MQKDGKFWGSFDTLIEAKQEIENEEKVKMYNVYKIHSDSCYSGFSLVAAENSEEANQFIRDFKKYDTHNNSNSWGYSEVEESDKIENIFSAVKGIVLYGITYSG